MSVKVYIPQEVYRHGEFDHVYMKEDSRFVDGYIKKQDHDRTVAAKDARIKELEESNSKQINIMAAWSNRIKELEDALRLLLLNWPPHRDGMDFEILPSGVRRARQALASKDEK